MRALLDLPSHIRDRLASALGLGMLDESLSTASLRSALGGDQNLLEIQGALAELRNLGVVGPAAAAWIRTLDDLVTATRAPDLVWSGPEVKGLHARDTRRVFEELLGSAERSLWVCTYAFFDGPRAFEVLARRMDATPALRTILLLNIQRKRGDTTVADQLVRRFADRFWKSDWPGKIRPQVFYERRSLDPDSPGGVLHAKAVIADDASVLVTSANFTEAALDRNIEVGLLVHDRSLALSLSSHFRALIDVGLLQALPSE